ncbi:GAF domain-containing protein [Rhizobiaceae bacterium BDR2-2]|uniref:histidine kinase n=1 Tax=Ectorhizobium quercum TaxID=2965071 RepID=A0AAE3MZU4_9HYPH|nr:HWE histidine kinase domain-containing protein [Ectorhizobium quercum]MCX8997392.1 GAF domain-containing protein [Ectorhizobium quercum]
MDNARQPATIDNCDREPIHIPGSIQPHGVMLVCDPVTFELRYASRNLAGLTNIESDSFPGMPLSDILGPDAVHELFNAAAKTHATGAPGIVLKLRLPERDGVFDATIHTHAERCFIEIEPCLDDGHSAEHALDLTRQLIARIGMESDFERLVKSGARLVQAMLGYDRVMIYRFLHNGAGRVIAEARLPHLNSFMGQHFPASDIPAQARRLYLDNPIRMISDVDSVPVPLLPPLAEGAAPVDMSHAQLRSVSPVHCEYLRNMGVSASLSISLIVEGRLWGLIACHHDTPRVTPLALRITAELFGHFFALQLGSIERRSRMIASTEARSQLDALIADIGIGEPIVPALADRLPMLARLVGCHGAALWMDGVWAATDTALTQDACRQVQELASDAGSRTIWHTQEIGAHIPDPVGTVAGVLAIPLSETFDDTLFLFRNEEAHEIEWAGEPTKTVVGTGPEFRLSPRGSFETWRQDVRGHSVPWHETDLAIAEAIRSWLRDVILRQTEAAAEERANAEQRRRILNDELNHRVKNVIALVKSIALQTAANAETVAQYSTSLEGRLQALATAHDQSLGQGDGVGSLADLIEMEAGLYRSDDDTDRIVAEGPELQLDDKAFSVVAMVLHEMMTNAVKYGALSTPGGRLAIAWSHAGNDLVIDWRESGGPAVSPPQHTGFGSRLIRSSLEYDLRGSAGIDYQPTGLVARFVIPARHVLTGPRSAPQPARIRRSTGTLDGLSVLVVEDQGLIAMDAEDTLRRLGASDVRLAAGVGEAMALLETFTPDVAVLDFNLGEETSEQVAQVLTARRLPFLFMTGYGDRVLLPESMHHVPIVRKPISPATIALQISAAQAAVARQTPASGEED